MWRPLLCHPDGPRIGKTFSYFDEFGKLSTDPHCGSVHITQARLSFYVVGKDLMICHDVLYGRMFGINTYYTEATDSCSDCGMSRNDDGSFRETDYWARLVLYSSSGFKPGAAKFRCKLHWQNGCFRI